MAHQEAPRPAHNHRDEPTYWFAILEIAKVENDFERAEAQRALRRLGVIVYYERREAAEGVVCA